jgi:cell division septation protein DedD
LTVKKITVALISNDTEEFKRFIVPKYLIVLTIIFGIFCAAYIGWLITNYQIVKSKMPLLVQLQKENEQQRIAFAKLADRIKQMAPKASKSQESDPNLNGSVKLKPVGNGHNGQIPDMSGSEPALIPLNYSIGGGEPPEEDKEPPHVATRLVASIDEDRKSSNGSGLAKMISTPVIEKPPSPEKMVTYPYSLQIGSYRTLKRADKAISIYRRKGLSPYWVEVDLGENGTWFRVFVGNFSNKEKSKNYILEHKISGSIIKRIAYANLIGIYSVEEQFEDEMLVLEKNGYFPYVIKDDEERFRLFVGAFFTKAGVEKQHAKLLDQGILNEIVKR